MSYDCYCDYDPASVYSARMQRAKKQYHCEECQEIIKPGERYEYVFGIWDGCRGIFRTCERCVDLRQWVRNNIPCFCWAHGNTIADAEEAIQEARRRAPDEMRGVTFGFLRMLYRVKREPRAPA